MRNRGNSPSATVQTVDPLMVKLVIAPSKSSARGNRQEEDLFRSTPNFNDGLIRWKSSSSSCGSVYRQAIECVHMAASLQSDSKSGLMADLLDWLNDSEIHPLIQSSVFHYEFEFIHPFSDGNGRMGRLWQTLILSRWNPIFVNIPVESLIYQNQKAYYEALQASTDRADSAPFIEFILQMILDAILSSNDTAQDSES
ncbi:hypothetical protein FQR65_LT19139 [Abscondita terminalis]|nr:hypothetical protein FQR65_LT19139 [Abscondita terminalis]